MKSPFCTFLECSRKVFAAALCQRHYNRNLKYGHPGCERCRINDPRPNQGLCTPCVAAEFVEYGHELINQQDYRTSNKPVPVRCLACGVQSTKWLNNLRAGHGCESCYAPTRAAIGDQSRFSQADAEAIAISIGLTPTGIYVNALTPFPCRCGRCGRDAGPRLGDVTAKLRAGKRVFGCEPCAHLQVGIDARIGEAEIRDDLLAAGIEYLDGYVNTQTSVRGRCLTCERIVSVRPGHIRAGHSGCFNCAATGYFSLRRLKRRTDLAQRPAYLYLVEFVDYNGTTFHKIGISTTADRLHRHIVLSGGTLLARQDDNLLTCCQAEQLILRHVEQRAYRPGQGRIKGGDTECFLPGEPIDLPRWIAAAHAVTTPSPAAGALSGRGAAPARTA